MVLMQNQISDLESKNRGLLQELDSMKVKYGRRQGKRKISKEGEKKTWMDILDFSKREDI